MQRYTGATVELMNSLRATHLAKSYKGKSVVRDVSLSVDSGQIVGLLGPNGAGKTTCFYMIVGLIKSDHGSIMLNISQPFRCREYHGYSGNQGGS
jgi:ABC-type lipopolysaccharide export system ATPase subunit